MNRERILSREVAGTQIPSGDKQILAAGTRVFIHQTLGGSYTVQVEGHLFRIEGTDADALGMEPAKGVQVPENASDEDLEKALWAQLHTCYDPEIPIDIVVDFQDVPACVRCSRVPSLSRAARGIGRSMSRTSRARVAVACGEQSAFNSGQNEGSESSHNAQRWLESSHKLAPSRGPGSTPCCRARCAT